MAVASSNSLTRLRAAAGSRSFLLLRHPPSSSNISKTNASNLNTATKDTKRFQWPKIWLFLPGAITFGLGTWQVFRRHEKINTLEHIQKRLSQDPIIYNHSSSNLEDKHSMEYRKMSLNGVFDETKSVYVGPRSRSISGVTENGYYVITPLVPLPGRPESVPSPVLVNRGWVPRSWKENRVPFKEPTNELTLRSSTWCKWFKSSKPAKSEQPVENGVAIIGVVRGSENPSIFVPQNDRWSGQWFYVDTEAMAEACGLPKGIIYVENLGGNVNPSCPYPIPKEESTLIRSSVMPQDHINYMLTWYTLSAAVTYMAVKRLTARNFR